MKERLLEFLRAENKSSAQLAEEIGVQASGISHILSGRNNPSLDFVLKMLERYKFLSTDWLLFGKGLMYKEPKNQSLFDNDPEFKSLGSIKPAKIEDSMFQTDILDVTKETIKPETERNVKKTGSAVVKIVWFFEDQSFTEYFPR